LLKTSFPKTKIKEVKSKGMPRILMPSRGQQNSIRGTNIRGKPDGAQIEYL
jgi:hypothetical protein